MPTPPAGAPAETPERLAFYERIGQKDSPHATHADVIDVILKEIPRKPDAIGFKAVHGGPISGAVRARISGVQRSE